MRPNFHAWPPRLPSTPSDVGRNAYWCVNTFCLRAQSLPLLYFSRSYLCELSVSRCVSCAFMYSLTFSSCLCPLFLPGGGKRRRGPMPENPSRQLHLQEPGAQHVQQSQGLYRNATCPEYSWPRSSHDAGGGGGGKASDLTGRTVDGSHLGLLNMSGDHVLPHSTGREGRPNRSGGGEEYGWGSSTQESFPPPHPRHAGQEVGSTAKTPSRGVGEGGRDEVEIWRERRGDGSCVGNPGCGRSCLTSFPSVPPPHPPHRPR